MRTNTSHVFHVAKKKSNLILNIVYISILSNINLSMDLAIQQVSRGFKHSVFH